MFNLVKWGVELKMNWLNWSIPISSGFQFQFNSNSKSFNSIPIQFMLNWIELIINSNSIHELIRALTDMHTCLHKNLMPTQCGYSPEAQGVVCGAVYVIVMFLFIPIPFYHHLTYRHLPENDFPFHEVSLFGIRIEYFPIMVLFWLISQLIEAKWCIYVLIAVVN